MSVDVGREVETYYDDTVVALSFSGGGTRAAAFSYGVLPPWRKRRIPGRSTSLIDRVDFVTGVSGGSVLAAYYGLKKRKALLDFKQRFLLRNAEEELKMDLSLLNIARGLQGGINDPTLFPRWLDDNLFEHATFKSLLTQRRPLVWINASDIYDRTPFVFGRVLFGALCSDLSTYPISMAVAASAAVPVVFAPVVIQKAIRAAARSPCRTGWNASAAIPTRRHCFGSLPMRSTAITPARCITSSCWMAGWWTITGLPASPSHALLPKRRTVHSSRKKASNCAGCCFWSSTPAAPPSGDWAQDGGGAVRRQSDHRDVRYRDRIRRGGQLHGVPGHHGAMAAVADRLALQAFGRRAAALWRAGRMELPGLKIFVGRVSFDQLDDQRAAKLNAIVTAFKLPPDQIDMLISAGHDAVKGSGVFNAFLNSMGGPKARPPRARGRPLVSSSPSQEALAQ